MKNLIHALFKRNGKRLFFLILASLMPAAIFAAEGSVPSIGPVRLEFVILGLILLCVSLFHKHTFWVAVTGLTVLLIFKFAFDPGWHVAVAYIIGFFTLYLILGWEPADNNEHKIENCPVPGCPMAEHTESFSEISSLQPEAAGE